MWGWLKTLRKDGFHFRRQAPWHGYYLDFVCLSRKLVIELDGAGHAEPAQRAHDERRDHALEDEGFTVLRIRNQAMDESMTGVVDLVFDALGARPPGR